MSQIPQLNAEQRIRMTIGDLIIQVELANDRVAVLSAELESERAKVAEFEAAAKAAKTPTSKS